MDVTHWQLAGGTSVEILDILDDHSRFLITSATRPYARQAMSSPASGALLSCTDCPPRCLPATALSAPRSTATAWSSWRASYWL